MKADIHVDAELLRRCQSGSAAAFKELVEQLKRPAYFHALSLTGNADDAMDISQEAFARVWQNLTSYDPALPFYGWYYTILKRLALNHIRNRSRRREESGSELIETQTTELGAPDSAHQVQQHGVLVRQVLEQMSLEDREILCLKDMQEHSYREIADILGIPIGTVMSRLYAARQRFRQKMKDGGYEHR